MKSTKTKSKQKDDYETEYVDAEILNDDGTYSPIRIAKSDLKSLRARNRMVKREIKKGQNEEDRHLTHLPDMAGLSSGSEDPAITQAEKMERETQKAYLRRHFHGLTLKVFCLCFLDGMKTGEAAKKLNRSPKTISNIKSEICKVLQKIRIREENKGNKN